MERYAEGIK